MQSSGWMRAQITTLIIATSLVQLANGFFGTFISLRVAMENFGSTMTGLVLSSYFAGFTLAALRCGRIIERIGHIRGYAAFAGVVAAATAAMALMAGSLAWLVLRAIVGFGCSRLFITTESWLNAKAQPSERGRVFSIYMVGTFVALAVGQLLIGRARIETTAPFSAIVALFAVALVMVSTTRAEPPIATTVETLPYGQLARAAPVAVVGCALSGLISGAFYALVPAWMQDVGTARETIALFMLVAVLGGLAFQVPVGWLSDRFDRRLVLAALGLGFCCLRCYSGSRAALPASGVTDRDTPGRLYVDPLPGLRLPCARPHASRSCRGGERHANPAERTRLGRGPTGRNGSDGAFQHRRRILLHGGRRAILDLCGRGPELDHNGAAPPSPAFWDLGAASDTARARSPRRLD